MYRRMNIANIDADLDSEDDDDEYQQPPSRRILVDWMMVGASLAATAIVHPLEYASTMMRLGYEPMAPRPSVALVGVPIVVLPNVLQYVGHIKKIDGFLGCYRGLMPTMLGQLLSGMYSKRFVSSLGLDPIEPDPKNREDPDANWAYNLKRDLLLCMSACVVGQPFRVIAARMMGQFVGRETIYNSTIGAIIEIFNTEGPRGFFAGLVPQMLGDVAVVLVSSITTYAVNTYFRCNRVPRMYNEFIVRRITANLLHPLTVVATSMCVSGARLAIARPPMMPLYKNWIHCFMELMARGELRRGSTLFLRSVDNAKAIEVMQNLELKEFLKNANKIQG